MPEANITVKKKKFPLAKRISFYDKCSATSSFPEPRLNTMPRNSSKEKTEHLAEGLGKGRWGMQAIHLRGEKKFREKES